MQKNTYTWKKTVGFILCFCILLFIVCIPFYSVRKEGYQYRDVYKKNSMIANEKENSLDVLFLGDSIGWASFSPIQLFGEEGISSYNCATPGQWSYDGLSILKKTVERQNPSVLIIEMNFVYSQPNQYKFLLSEILPVFHYHGFYDVGIYKTHAVDFKGMNLYEKAQAYTGKSDYMHNTSNSIISVISKKYLDEIVQLCKEDGIQILAVSSPSASNWTDGKHAAVAEWCNENEIAYVDFNEQDEIDKLSFNWDTDTRDGGDHLNLSGSKKVTARIGEILKEKYSLIDHRNDAAYTSWMELYNSCGLYQK